MPIMALFRSSRVDRTVYDAIIQELDLERRPAAGTLTHACGFDDQGICVVDVWESRQEFDEFFRDRLRPVFAKLNVEIEMPTILDAYAFTVTDEVDRYKEGAAPAQTSRSSAAEQPRPV